MTSFYLRSGSVLPSRCGGVWYTRYVPEYGVQDRKRGLSNVHIFFLQVLTSGVNSKFSITAVVAPAVGVAVFRS